MIRSFLAAAAFLLLLLAQLTTLQRCATPSAPTGGARDTIGPALVLEKSSPNFQTNSRPEEIILTFDEWVKLDPKQQILISPPLELGEDNRPELRRRSLVINLAGLELRDSVTYVVNIGAAVQDLNESNPTENLRFVFATGPVLDSASVSGTLVDDFTGKPIDAATFTLYGNLADTAALTENPTYFAQTDKEGRFTVYNIRPGRYRATALLRNPAATNYYLDFAGFAQPQSVGFVDSVLTVADGSNTVGAIRLSAIPRPLRVNTFDSTMVGQYRLVLNQPAEGVDLLSQRTYLRRNDQDTLRLFYRSAGPDSILVGRDGAWADTLVVVGTPATKQTPLRLLSAPGGRLNPEEGVVLRYNQPLETVDTSRIRLLRDTLTSGLPYRYALDTLYPGVLRLQVTWASEGKYRLQVLPDALTAWSGATNTDTLALAFTAGSPEQYGTLNLGVSGLDSTQQYLLRLVESDKVVPETQRVLRNTQEATLRYAGLKPATYLVEIIVDANANGRYDAGSYLLRRQPETIRRFPIEALRANWEVDEKINLNSTE